jgi:hypothetical protein
MRRLVEPALRCLYAIFCRHRSALWVRTIHGDEIIRLGYKRTELFCEDCGRFILIDDYITKDMAIRIYPQDIRQAADTTNHRAYAQGESK